MENRVQLGNENIAIVKELHKKKTREENWQKA